MTKVLRRGLFARMFGIPATRPPKDPGCWSFDGREVTLDLALAPELASPGGAVRLEGRGLPERVLVFRGDDGKVRALRNRCGHVGRRRLDPVPGEATVQCCSVGHSTYDYTGEVVAGPAKRGVEVYWTLEADGAVRIELTAPGGPGADASG